MRNCYNRKHAQSYYLYAVLIAALISRFSLITYLVAMIRKIPLIGSISGLMMPLIFICLIVFAYKRSIFRFTRPVDLLVPLFLVAGIIITICVYPQNEEYIWQNFGAYISFCIPAYFIGVCSVEYDEGMFKIISEISCVAIVFSCFLMLFLKSGDNLGEDEMGLAYATVLNIMFVMAYFKYSKIKLYGIISIIGLGFLLVLGTRGPLIIALAFLFLCLALESKNRIPFIIGTILLIVFFQSNMYSNLLQFIYLVLSRYGFSTRIVKLLMQGDLVTHLSGRDMMAQLLKNLLNQRPWVGYGLFGEWPFIGWNAHNLYLEIIFEYGYFFGIGLILWYISQTIFTFIKEKDEPARYFMLIFIVFIFVQGLVGYSHLRPEIFLLLGFCIKRKRMRKYYCNYEEQYDYS